MKKNQKMTQQEILIYLRKKKKKCIICGASYISNTKATCSLFCKEINKERINFIKINYKTC